MPAWLFVGYVLLVLAVAAAASCVALFAGDGERREMAYRVLNLFLGTSATVGALVLMVVRLLELVM